MAGFTNPITGSNGSLDIPQIKSPNYVPGVAGWIISRLGSAEFNNLTIRGTFKGTEFIIDATGLYFYTGVPGAGNGPVFWITSAAADPFGNAISSTVGVNGGTGFFSFFTPGLAGSSTDLADGILQKTIGNALACKMTLDRNNPSAVNEINWLAKSNFGLLDAQLSLIPQFIASVPPQLTLTQAGMFVNAANNLVAANSAREAWHDLRPLVNSFVGTNTNEWPPQFRVASDGDLEIFGSVQTPVSGSYNGVTWATLPAEYRPTRFCSLPVAQVSGAMSSDTTTSGSPRLYVDSSGALQFFGLSPSLNNTMIRFSGRIPLTNAPISL